MKKVIVKSPGRICVLGEHQDYFNLPVISAAIDKYIVVEIEQKNDDICEIFCKDTNEYYKFRIDEIPLGYAHSRDYIRSVVNTVYKMGYFFKTGFKAVIYGDIPMKGGLSSSSALNVAFASALSYFNGERFLPPDKLALLGFTSEVLEFKEHGGMMDHISSAYGGIMHIDFSKTNPEITKLNIKNSDFIIADSDEPKDTAITGLAVIKSGVHRALEAAKEILPDSNIHNIKIEQLDQIDSITIKDRKLITGTLKTRDITARGFDLLQSESVKPEEFGALINEQHEVLRDYLEISTPKIERIINASIEKGALGCKIIGSGGGGCVLIYAPGSIDKVKKSVIASGGIPFDISISKGTFCV